MLIGHLMATASILVACPTDRQPALAAIDASTTTLTRIEDPVGVSLGNPVWKTETTIRVFGATAADESMLMIDLDGNGQLLAHGADLLIQQYSDASPCRVQRPVDHGRPLHIVTPSSRGSITSDPVITARHRT
jgi:hypothetical protein